MKIILASKSPRRRELLLKIGLEFEVFYCDTDENTDKTDPKDIVIDISRKKGRAARNFFTGEDVIISADTVVYHEGKIMGKPKDENEAFDMLSKLSGKWHEVYTGVTVLNGTGEMSGAERTRVKFVHLSEDMIKRYIKTKESMDKAGAYGIQGRGSLLAERIDGDFYNVMGLPLNLTASLLKKYGIILL